MAMTTEYSRQVLEEAPERVLTLLSGIGTSLAIRAHLARVGYCAKDHEEGWRLLHAAAGYDATIPTLEAEEQVALAIAELDAWDEPHFRLARAALGRRYPAQAAFLFEKLEATQGAAAVLSVKTFLDRLDMLEGKAPGRNHKDKATKAADFAALTALASRGITHAERLRLRGLIKTAEEGAELSERAKQQAEENEKQQAARQGALVALRAWFDEWAETARVVIKRRDQLIRLGLAKRRTGGGEEDPEPAPAAEPDKKPEGK